MLNLKQCLNDIISFKKEISEKNLITADILETLFRSETLTTTATAGANYSSASASCARVGNVLRISFSATRSSAPSSGNVTNETIMTVKVSCPSEIIGNAYNVSSVSGSTGSVTSFFTSGISQTTTELTFNINLAATTTTSTALGGQILIPFALNIDAVL